VRQSPEQHSSAPQWRKDNGTQEAQEATDTEDQDTQDSREACYYNQEVVKEEVVWLTSLSQCTMPTSLASEMP
jgi:hypothetical protein